MDPYIKNSVSTLSLYKHNTLYGVYPELSRKNNGKPVGSWRPRPGGMNTEEPIPPVCETLLCISLFSFYFIMILY